MAEVLGAVASVFTLLGLLKGCIDACEVMRTAKSQNADLEKLDLKLALEQCRLKAWGRNLGLIEVAGVQKRNLLEHFESRELVQLALQHILDLLTDSHNLRKRYGGLQVSAEETSKIEYEPQEFSPVLRLRAAFKRFRIGDNIYEQPGKAKGKYVWVFQDRKKYEALVVELRTLVNAIEQVTKDLVDEAQQQKLVISRINTISDPTTLNMITEVCEVDHPVFSDAASVRAEVVSTTANTTQPDVIAWIDGLSSILDQVNFMEDMESWDLTTAKHKYLELLNASHANSTSPTEPSLAEGQEGSFSDEIENGDHGETEEANEKRFTEQDVELGGPVEFSNALAYVNKIKHRFADRARVYMQFLEILQAYQRRQKTISRVYEEVAELFISSPDLVEGFKLFLPETVSKAREDRRVAAALQEGIDSIPPREAPEFLPPQMKTLEILYSAALGEATPDNTIEVPSDVTKGGDTNHNGEDKRAPILNDALEFLDMAKLRFRDQPDVYNRFLDIMKDFKKGVIDTPGTMTQVGILFMQARELVEGFNSFLPPDYSMTPGDGVVVVRVPSGATWDIRKPGDDVTESQSDQPPERSAEGVMVYRKSPTGLTDETISRFDMNDRETLASYANLLSFWGNTDMNLLELPPNLRSDISDFVQSVARELQLDCVVKGEGRSRQLQLKKQDRTMAITEYVSKFGKA
ncbi:prion-inhibition and propagation-domain-containing protein [Xylariomycetidae sp. FL2044]|nr:prion-inhibition and propagation-domain-containing protein [Xylariomycetidae sp. FL2044]